MPGEEAIALEGTVVETLPNALFRVELPNGHRLLAHTSGRMRMNFVRLAVGDRVTVKCSPYDLSKGCIAFNEEKKI